MSKLPLCFFPTKTILIDDDIDFLRLIEMGLSKKHTTYQLFDSPDRAIHFLNEEYKPNPFTEQLVNTASTFDYAKHMVSVKTDEIFKEVFNKERFSQISTVIVDYSMPDINGLELCKQIKDPNIQKILLTGEADEGIALQAYSDGIIHKFIRKQNEDRLNLLDTAIKECQINYFNRLSEFVLKTADPGTFSVMNDPGFVDFFERFLEKEKIVEYYSLDEFGSFLALDATGRTRGFFVRNEDRMKDVEIEAESEPEIPLALRNGIKKREKVLCYHNMGRGAFPEFSEWDNYFAEAVKFKGNEDYYCGISEHLDFIDFDKISVFSTARATLS